MKPRFVNRDTLYNSLDRLISSFIKNKKKLPEIVLTKDQYEIFTGFNLIDGDGYYYRNIKIRCR